MKKHAYLRVCIASTYCFILWEPVYQVFLIRMHALIYSKIAARNFTLAFCGHTLIPDENSDSSDSQSVVLWRGGASGCGLCIQYRLQWMETL